MYLWQELIHLHVQSEYRPKAQPLLFTTVPSIVIFVAFRRQSGYLSGFFAFPEQTSAHVCTCVVKCSTLAEYSVSSESIGPGMDEIQI